MRAELLRSGAEVHYQFDRLNSFVVSLPEKALAGISRNPNVISVEVGPVRELVRNMPASLAESILPEQVVPYGIDMVQARNVWDANRDGKVDKKAPPAPGAPFALLILASTASTKTLWESTWSADIPRPMTTPPCGRMTVTVTART